MHPYWLDIQYSLKIRTKVVHKNVRKDDQKVVTFSKIGQTLHNTKVASLYIALMSILRKICVSTSKSKKGTVPLPFSGIGLRSAHTIGGSIRGRVGFTLELF